MLLRTLVELEGTAQKLSPKFSLAEVIRPYYTEIVQRRLSPRRIFNRVRRAYHDWERLAESLPRALDDLVGRVRDGSFSVHLYHRKLDPVVNRLVLGLITASLIVGSSLLWSMKAPPTLAGVSIMEGPDTWQRFIWAGACCEPSRNPAIWTRRSRNNRIGMPH